MSATNKEANECDKCYVCANPAIALGEFGGCCYEHVQEGCLSIRFDKEKDSPFLQWRIINRGNGKYDLFSNRNHFGEYHKQMIVPWGFGRSFEALIQQIQEMEKELEK